MILWLDHNAFEYKADETRLRLFRLQARWVMVTYAILGGMFIGSFFFSHWWEQAMIMFTVATAMAQTFVLYSDLNQQKITLENRIATGKALKHQHAVVTGEMWKRIKEDAEDYVGDVYVYWKHGDGSYRLDRMPFCDDCAPGQFYVGFADVNDWIHYRLKHQ